MSNVKKINIPLEDSICGDIDEEESAEEDDETFSSRKNLFIEFISIENITYQILFY